MPLIQDPTIVRKLQQSLRLIALPDALLAPEIVPVILVSDLSAPLADIERGCSGADEVGAAVGEFSIITLTRIGGARTADVTITGVTMGTRSTQTMLFVVFTAAVVGLALSGQTSFDDLELPGRPTSRLGTDTQVGLPGNRVIHRVRLLADTSVRIPMKIRLGNIDQGTVGIVGLTQNTGIFGGYEWTESPPLG